MQENHIAIDGPSGVGKSTLAKALAGRLGIAYVDTGAMYRAVGVKAMRQGVDTSSEAALAAMLEDTALSVVFRGGEQLVLLDGEDVGDSIRTPQASRAASEVSRWSAVRERMVAMQRDIAKGQPVVMDGRDIGTHVLPGARHKFYLTASAHVRAKRRYDELRAKGKEVSYEEVLGDMVLRDEKDATRAASPLRPAQDAHIIDTDAMDVEQELEAILSLVGADYARSLWHCGAQSSSAPSRLLFPRN